MTQIDIQYLGHLRTRCVHKESGAALETDAPKENQGKGELFSPTDLVAAALGSCVLTLMGIAARRLSVDLTGLRLTVVKEMASAPSRKVGRLKVDVYCPQEFDTGVKKKLEEAAMTCPVHHSLHPDVVKEYTFHWGQP